MPPSVLEIGQKRRANECGSANGNHAGDKPDADDKADAAKRLGAVVLSSAQLIGRQMAREDFEKSLRAANDNQRDKSWKSGSIIRTMNNVHIPFLR